MKKSFWLLLLVSLLFSAMASSEEVISSGERLSLERCLEIALKNHPQIVAYMNAVKASQSRLGQAQANFFPQVNFSGNYHQTEQKVEELKVDPLSGATRTESVDKIFEQYNASLAVNQLLFDFGKSYHQVKVQSYNLEVARWELEQVTQQVVFNVKQAYYQYLVAKRKRDLAEEVVKQLEEHLKQAEGFYQAGKKPKFDVTRAEVDLSNARLDLIKMENALQIARVNLNNVMGVSEAGDYTVEDTLDFQKYEINLEQALAKAYENRPDLKSLDMREKSAKQAVSLAWSGYAPVLNGTASYNWAGEELPMEDSWTIGLNLNFSIFNGFLTKHQVDESKANLNIARANQELVRQSIILEVQQAYLNLKASEQSIPVAELALKQAEENLELAKGRYQAGVGNPIEVTDAEVAYVKARTNYLQALYDYKMAQASLLKAMGER